MTTNDPDSPFSRSVKADAQFIKPDPRTIMRPDRIASFWSKVDRTDACWHWRGSVNNHGYGLFSIGRRYSNYYAHRVAYSLVRGQIPHGLTIDHLCRNRLCVNPDHLEPVTNAQNVLRGVGWTARNARVTHCPQGHPYSGSNLHIRYCLENGSRRPVRRCKACRRDYMRRVRLAARTLPASQEDK